MLQEPKQEEMYTPMNPTVPLLGQLSVSSGEASLVNHVETAVYTNIGSGSSANGVCEQQQQVATKLEGEDRYVTLY